MLEDGVAAAEAVIAKNFSIAAALCSSCERANIL